MIKVKIQLSVEDPENSRYIDEVVEFDYEKPKQIDANLTDQVGDWIDDEILPQVYKW